MTNLLKPISLLSLLLCLGCVNQATVKVASQSAQPSFQTVDTRNAEQKESSIGSLLLTSCDYGLQRMGDDKEDPHRLVLLNNKLANHFNPQLSGKTVTVKTFDVHINQQLYLRNSNPGAGGIIGDAILGMGCFADSKTAGGYDLEENPAGGIAAVVQIVVEIDGTTTARGIEVAKPAESVFSGPDLDTPRVHAIQKALNNLVAKLKKTL